MTLLGTVGKSYDELAEILGFSQGKPVSSLPIIILSRLHSVSTHYRIK